MRGMQELCKKFRRNQNISSYRQTQSRKVYALFVFLFICLFVFACYFMVKFLILKEIDYSKFINLNPTSYFTNLLLSLCFCAMLLSQKMLFICFYLFSNQEASLLFILSIFLFILFIDGCTELGDSNVVTTLAMTILFIINK